MLKQVVAKFFHAFGYEVFHRSKLLPTDMAGHVRAILDKYQVDCVLDVGANEGQFAYFLREMVGYHGLLVSFEPAADTFKILAAKAADDKQWLTFNCALGEGDAERQFNVMKSSALNSFLEPDRSETTLFDAYNIVTKKETVRMRTVDAVVDEVRQTRNLRRIYLKIDTQGYDMQVIQGAASSLPDVAAIQTEAAFQRLYAGMPGHLESLGELDRLGWDLSGVFPIQTDSSYRLIEADCIFVNRALARQLSPELLEIPGLTHV
jgi:FkbM family methyltransferase